MTQETNDRLPDVAEPKQTFNSISDRIVLKVVNDEHPDIVLMEISGFDLSINFNMEYLKTVEDIEAAVNGISDMFRNLIIDRIVSNKQKDS